MQSVIKTSLVFAILTISTPTYAQTPPSPEELIRVCQSDQDAGRDTEDLATDLLRRHGITLQADDVSAGKACLRNQFKSEFVYVETGPQSGFYQAASPVAARLLEQEQSARLAANRAAYNSRLMEACFDMLAEDEFLALTTERCAGVFLAVGLPQSY